MATSPANLDLPIPAADAHRVGTDTWEIRWNLDPAEDAAHVELFTAEQLRAAVAAAKQSG